MCKCKAAAFTPGTFQENHLATSRKAEILHKALDKDEETSETWETCTMVSQEMETPRDFTGAFSCAFTIHLSYCVFPCPGAVAKGPDLFGQGAVRCSKHCSKY